MKAYFLVLFVVLASCGQNQGGNGSSSGVSSVDQANRPVDASNANLEGRKAELVASASELKACDEITRNSIFYALDSKEFFYCGQEGWEVLNLKGSVGDKGEKGDEGVAGQDGKNGRDGRDAISVGPSEWLNPIDGKLWFLGRNVAPTTIINQSDLCPIGSYSPSEEEAQEAIDSGLLAKLGSYFSDDGLAILSNDLDPDGRWVMHLIMIGSETTSSIVVTVNHNVKTYVFCVKN